MKQNRVTVIPQSQASLVKEPSISKVPENSSFGYASDIPNLRDHNSIASMKRYDSKMNPDSSIKIVEEVKISSKVTLLF